MANQLLSIGYAFGANTTQTYNISGNTYSEITNVPIADAASRSLDWSPSGELLAIGQDVTSGGAELFVFSYSGNVWTERFSESTATTGTAGVVNSVAWSGDSARLAYSYHEVRVVYRGDGTTYSSTTVATSSELFKFRGLAWNADDSTLAAGINTSPYIRTFNRSGNTYSSLGNPGTLPTGNGNDTSWSPSGNLAVAHDTSPYITIYSRSGDTFTKLSNPGTLPAGDAKTIAYSPDGQILAVGHDSSPYLTLYTISGTTYTKIADPTTLPTDTVNGISWNHVSNKLFVAANNPGEIFAYSRSANVFTADSSISGIRNTTPTAVDLYSAGTTQSGVSTLTSTASLTASGKISTQSASATLTSAFGINARVLSDILYVDSGYIVADYFQQGKDSDYFFPDYIQDGYVAAPIISGQVLANTISSLTSTITRLQLPVANLSTTSTVTTIGDKIISLTVNYSSQTTLTSLGVKQANVSTALSSVTTLTSEANKTVSPVITLASAATVTADSNYTASPSISLSTNAFLVSVASTIKKAGAVLTAFDTVVTVSARIRSTQSDMVSTTTFSAVAVKVHGARIGEVSTGLHFSGDRYITVNPTPIAAYPGTSSLALQDTSSPAFGSTVGYVDVGGAGNGFIVSIWARQSQTSTQNRSLLSSSTFASVLGAKSDYRFNLGGMNTVTNSADIGFTGVDDANGPTYVPGIGIGAPFIPDTEWHHFLWHFTQFNDPIGIRTVVSTANVYIDGARIGAFSSTAEEGTAAYIAEPLYIGIQKQQQGNTPPLNLMREETLWEGDIKQIWIGFDSLGGNLAGGNYNFNIQDFYSDGLVNLGQYGRGLANNLPQPMVYEPLDYYTLPTSIGSDLTAHLFSNSASMTGNITSFDSSWLPADAIRGLESRFTLTAIGDNTKEAEANAASAFSLSAFGGYNKPASSTISTVATFTANTYNFTKATATLSSVFTSNNVTNRIKTASISLTSAFTVNFDADETNKGLATLASTFTLLADATTAQLGRAQLASNFNLTATPYNFTKAQASIQAAVSLVADGKFQARTRANATLAAVSTFSATAKRFRSSTADLTSAFTVTLAPGNALRSGSVTMSAFDTVLSAGKIIEFLAENTIVVTEEQRRLRVALESTVLLVQMANGVNTITAETTDIVVPQEQGRLLAQYNSPTN